MHFQKVTRWSWCCWCVNYSLRVTGLMVPNFFLHTHTPGLRTWRMGCSPVSHRGSPGRWSWLCIKNTLELSKNVIQDCTSDQRTQNTWRWASEVGLRPGNFIFNSPGNYKVQPGLRIFTSMRPSWEGLRQRLPVLHHSIRYFRTSLVAQMVKNLLAMQKTRVGSLGQEGPLEKGIAACSSIFA